MSHGLKKVKFVDIIILFMKHFHKQKSDTMIDLTEINCGDANKVIYILDEKKLEPLFESSNHGLLARKQEEVPQVYNGVRPRAY